ncbi:DNA polymerase III [Neisseria weixii]|uniref:DNA polymerase III n=1 Tax=Neisseria weixii TaxID=1853276 RepID=UPI003623D7A5
MNTEQLEIKRNSVAHGLAFLGTALLQIGEMKSSETEQLGCLLLCLSEYAQSLEA